MLKTNNVSNHNEIILPPTHLHDKTYRGRYCNSQIPANKVPETSEFRNYLSTVTNTSHFVRILCVLLSTMAYSHMIPPEALPKYSTEVC
jgi:hypothetical protein